MFGIEAMMGFVQSEFPWRSVLANSVLKGDYDVTLFGGRIAFYAITTIHQSIPSQTLSPKPLVYRCIGANAFIGTRFAGAMQLCHRVYLYQLISKTLPIASGCCY